MVGLLIAGVAVKGGFEAWRGESCVCVGNPLAAAGDIRSGRKAIVVCVLGKL